MKKLTFFSVLLLATAWINGNAFGNCKVEACGGRGNDCISAYELEVNPGYSGEIESYVCEKGHCENGTIVHDLKLEKFFICRIASESGPNFAWMGNDTWLSRDVKNCHTTNNDYFNRQVSNSTKILQNSTKSTVTFRNENTGAKVIGAGNDICIAYKCNEGFLPNEDQTACVSIADRRKAELEKKCKDINGGKVNASGNGCDCENSSFEIVGTKCIDKAAVDAARFECEKGGGKIIGGACDCSSRSSKKQWDPAKKKCVLSNEETDKINKQKRQAADSKQKRKEACKKATDTEWDNSGNGKCTCKDKQKNWDEKKCVFNENVTNCNILKDSGERVTWDLIKDKCVCEDPGFFIQANKCIESPEAKSAREYQEKRDLQEKEEKAQASQKQSADKIKNSLAQINTLRQSYGDGSVWKTAEGKFNTSRLVSDSVAGVVLGTAGGLITSSVIKKNQIKGGFEDISCAIGGQTVAGWGDEFNVGIR
ncbi:MAG: hypothetical protein LBF28_00405 [Rickettsiales bacterium]|nr:hypothetical protein [Rickettsiales bacterium]